jgi:hypothetical protein
MEEDGVLCGASAALFFFFLFGCVVGYVYTHPLSPPLPSLEKKKRRARASHKFKKRQKVREALKTNFLGINKNFGRKKKRTGKV